MGRMDQFETDSAILIEDDLCDRLATEAGGAAVLCYQCGVCSAACPWGLVKGEPLSVHEFMRFAQLGLPVANEHLWLCTTCGQCEASCPREVKIGAVFRSLRAIAWEQRKLEKGLSTVLWSVYWNNNPWSQPPSHRSRWAKNLAIPVFQPERHEVLLYVGCTSSYDRRAQKIAQALIRVLNAAGVQFGYLGNDEPCCGEGILSLGHLPYFEEVAAQAAQVFQEKGVKQLVAISPHCYDVFKNHYPPIDNGFQPIHYTQYLARLLAEGRLKLDGRFEMRVTIQDPCYLGRHNAEYAAPRRVLAAIPGVELIEMERSGADGLCCGGGGGRMWLETPLGERFSDLRVQEASQTGANILATACPFCIVCLEDSAKVLKMDQLQVMDIAEIAAMAFGGY
jgi:Fe-S oxidoreductase